MNRSDQRQAQQRIARIAAFRAELAALEGEQVVTLTPEQRTGIEAHLDRVLAGLATQFGVDVTASAQRISWGMRVAALLGGVAFFAALVLFLHRIWGVLPLWGQVFLLTAIPLLFLGAAEFTWRHGVDRFYPALLALAAGVGFVMGLTILGGILNAAPSPHALVVWAVFAVLAAYAYGVRMLLGAGLLLLCGYAAALAVAASGGFWPNLFDRAGFLIPAAVVCYSVPVLWKAAIRLISGIGIMNPDESPSPGYATLSPSEGERGGVRGRDTGTGSRVGRDPHDFDFVYRACGAVAGLTALMVLSQRGDPCCSGLPLRASEALYQLAGLGASVGVVFHGLRLGRSGLVNLGAVGFVVFLYVRLHAWWWHWMPKYLFFFLIGLIAIGLLLLFRRMRLRLTERAAP